MLGGQTKVLKSYGRAKTNTVNRLQSLHDDEATTTSSSRGASSSTACFNQKRLGFSRLSDSDDTEEEEEGDIYEAPAPSKPLPPKVQRSKALSEIRSKRANKPATGMGKASDDKENVIVVVEHFTPSKTTSKGKRPQILKSRPRVNVQSPIRTSRLAPPSVGPKARTLAPSPLSKSTTFVDELESTEESEPPVRAGSKAKGARRRIVMSEDEYEDTDDDKVIVQEVKERTSRLRRAPVKSYKEVDEDDILGTSPAIVEKVPETAAMEDPHDLADEEETSSEAEEEEIDEQEEEDDFYALPSRPPVARSTYATPSFLSPLLALSPNPHVLNFTSFVSSPPIPFNQITSWKKVGEASYSEVFSTTDEKGRELVVKIVPVARMGDAEVEKEEEPYKSEWEAVKREVEVSKLVGSGDVRGFVQFKGMFLVQGSYPTQLLACWDQFKMAQTPPSDEQIRPDVLTSNQIYALIILDHSGVDLESYKVKCWRDALNIFEQVLRSLMEGEEKWEFEHRDLHWGNVLVRPTEWSLTSKMRRLSLSTKPQPTIEVTLIDFTLSRATIADQTVYDSFEDGCIFEGEGDEQFDVYRAMKEVTKGDWEKATPFTNVLWLHYLAGKLLRAKKLRLPQAPSPSSSADLFSPRSVTSIHQSPRRSRAGAPGRKCRTLPQKTPKEEAKEMRAEMVAYEGLVKVERVLAEVVERESKGKTGVKKGKSRNQKKVDDEVVLGSMAELWSWYNAEGLSTL